MSTAAVDLNEFMRQNRDSLGPLEKKVAHVFACTIQRAARPKEMSYGQWRRWTEARQSSHLVFVFLIMQVAPRLLMDMLDLMLCLATLTIYFSTLTCVAALEIVIHFNTLISV